MHAVKFAVLVNAFQRDNKNDEWLQDQAPFLCSTLANFGIQHSFSSLTLVSQIVKEGFERKREKKAEGFDTSFKCYTL